MAGRRGLLRIRLSHSVSEPQRVGPRVVAGDVEELPPLGDEAEVQLGGQNPLPPVERLGQVGRRSAPRWRCPRDTGPPAPEPTRPSARSRPGSPRGSRTGCRPARRRGPPGRCGASWPASRRSRPRWGRGGSSPPTRRARSAPAACSSPSRRAGPSGRTRWGRRGAPRPGPVPRPSARRGSARACAGPAAASPSGAKSRSVQCRVPVVVRSLTPTHSQAFAFRAARPIRSVAGEGTSTQFAANRRKTRARPGVGEAAEDRAEDRRRRVGGHERLGSTIDPGPEVGRLGHESLQLLQRGLPVQDDRRRLDRRHRHALVSLRPFPPLLPLARRVPQSPPAAAKIGHQLLRRPVVATAQAWRFPSGSTTAVRRLWVKERLSST